MATILKWISIILNRSSLKPLGASVKDNQTDVKKERKTNKKK